MTMEDFEPELENDGDGTTPDFDAMDDKTFAAFLEGRDSTPSDSLQDLSDQSDDADLSTGEDRLDTSYRSPWLGYSPDDVDRQIAAARAEPDTEATPVRIDELSDELFDVLGRMGRGDGTGQDRRALREAGLLHLVAPEFRGMRTTRRREAAPEPVSEPLDAPQPGLASGFAQVEQARRNAYQIVQDRAAGRGRQPIGTTGTDQADTGVLGLPNDHSATISRSADALGLRSLPP